MAPSPVSVLWAVPVRACRAVSCLAHLGREREASSGTLGDVAALLGGSLLARSQRCRALLSAAAPAATIHHTGNETKRFRVHLEGLGRQLVLG